MTLNILEMILYKLKIGLNDSYPVYDMTYVIFGF